MEAIVVAVITGAAMVTVQWLANRPARRKVEEVRVNAEEARVHAEVAAVSAAATDRIVQGNGKGDVGKMLETTLLVLGRIEQKIDGHAGLPAERAHPKP